MRPDGSRRVFEGGLISVDVEQWGDHEREVVRHPGAVAIVSVDAGGYVTLVRQLREPARKRLLELPAGTREADEEPLATAKRELEEEAGLAGGKSAARGQVLLNPGLLRRARLHLLRQGRGADRAEAQGDEEIEVVRVPVAEIASLLFELEDAKTLAGLLLYLHAR